MKKIFTLVAAALLVAAPALFTSCDDDPWYDDEPTTTTTTTPTMKPMCCRANGTAPWSTPMVTTGRRVPSMPI